MMTIYDLENHFQHKFCELSRTAVAKAGRIGGVDDALRAHASPSAVGRYDRNGFAYHDPALSITPCMLKGIGNYG
jgi:hypothetical protein